MVGDGSDEPRRAEKKSTRQRLCALKDSQYSPLLEWETGTRNGKREDVTTFRTRAAGARISRGAVPATFDGSGHRREEGSGRKSILVEEGTDNKTNIDSVGQ